MKINKILEESADMQVKAKLIEGTIGIEDIGFDEDEEGPTGISLSKLEDKINDKINSQAEAAVNGNKEEIKDAANAINTKVELEKAKENNGSAKGAEIYDSVKTANEFENTEKQVQSADGDLLSGVFIESRSTLMKALDKALSTAKQKGDSNPLNVLVTGLPGSGKTAIISTWCSLRGLKFFELNVKTNEIDALINGYPAKDDTKKNAITQYFSDALEALSKPNTVLFLDEFNRQPNAYIRGILLGLINEKKIPGKNGTTRNFKDTLLFTVIAINPFTTQSKEDRLLDPYGTDSTTPLGSAERNRLDIQITYNSNRKDFLDYISKRYAEATKKNTELFVGTLNDKNASEEQIQTARNSYNRNLISISLRHEFLIESMKYMLGEEGNNYEFGFDGELEDPNTELLSDEEINSNDEIPDVEKKADSSLSNYRDPDSSYNKVLREIRNGDFNLFSQRAFSKIILSINTENINTINGFYKKCIDQILLANFRPEVTNYFTHNGIIKAMSIGNKLPLYTGDTIKLLSDIPSVYGIESENGKKVYKDITGEVAPEINNKKISNNDSTVAAPNNQSEEKETVTEPQSTESPAQNRKRGRMSKNILGVR